MSGSSVFQPADRNIMKKLFGFALVVSSFHLQMPAFTDTTINVTNHFAYGANIGWIEARGDVTNGLVVGQLFCTGYVWSANCGWIHFGKGPTNGYKYSNTSAADFGVNVEGTVFRGYAYGANIGWINFETNGNPRIDLLTGRMTGYAWSANVGWIGLSNSFAHVQTDCLAPGIDTDGDGIPDAWEFNLAGDLTTYGPHPDDDDLDGVSDYEEYVADTHPGMDNSYLHITELERLSPTSEVTWTVSPTRVYALEHSETTTNNAIWVDSGFGIMTPGTDPTLTRGVSDASLTTRFYRARAIIPLQKP